MIDGLNTEAKKGSEISSDSGVTSLETVGDNFIPPPPSILIPPSPIYVPP